MKIFILKSGNKSDVYANKKNAISRNKHHTSGQRNLYQSDK